MRVEEYNNNMNVFLALSFGCALIGPFIGGGGGAFLLGFLGLIIYLVMSMAGTPKSVLECEHDYEINTLESHLQNVLTEVTDEQKDVLLRKYSQLVFVDDYGSEVKDKWFKEISYFCKKNLLPHVHPQYIQSREGKLGVMDMLVNSVDASVSTYLEDNPSDLKENTDDMSPIEYEHYCAELLRERGWNTKVTKASGDQGVDVIATRGQLKIAVQCKMYAKPVGNKAVQEIRTGAEFVEAKYGIVVAPNGFTRSAKELANKTGVKLIHHSELQDID